MKSDFDFIVERNVVDFLLKYIVFDYIITTKTTVKRTMFPNRIHTKPAAVVAQSDRIIKPFSMLALF